MTILKPRLLLLSDDADQRKCWAAVLEQTAGGVWTDAASVLDDDTIDIVIATTAAAANAGQWLVNRTAEHRAGTIMIGQSNTADVTLPCDATPRELQLATRLLAEIIQMRRERQVESRSRAALIRLANSDPLTGLANRRAWNEYLESRLATADAWCLAIVDLDHFKQVNDRLGHSAGDEILKATASALASQIRDVDFAARLGGDEFGILLSDLDAARAQQVVDRLRRAVSAQAVTADGQRQSASAGFAVRSADEDLPAERLFDRADAALRQAKNQGRDCCIGAD